ncbi:MAG TPA: hypothetical protein VG317_17445 [Pseudonocardiaceae bacterium]|jgi:hypothetical protein|nr:hypothetical protein [Pseudonocardiaceae bacterium]
MTAQPDSPHIGLVVEGPGDREAVPVLLRRYLELHGVYGDLLGKPIPCNGRGRATVANGIEGYAATAAARPGCRAVLVILDSDDDAVCKLGPELEQRVKRVVGVPVVIVLAEKCYEDWLYASAETLQIGINVHIPDRRGQVAIRMAMGTKYIKPVWQPKLTHRVDLKLARQRSHSLNRLFEKFDKLREAVDSS